MQTQMTESLAVFKTLNRVIYLICNLFTNTFYVGHCFSFHDCIFVLNKCYEICAINISIFVSFFPLLYIYVDIV